MIPVFFGEKDSQLFGIYHPPQSDKFSTEGILLCPPAAHEYERAHWAFKQLANSLSKEGLHVFRFDYYATGDSAGETGTGHIVQWEKDIHTAAGELKDMSGITKISLVGLRLGAALAAKVSCVGLDVDKLILWDPVIYGKRYLNELKKIHERKVLEYGRLDYCKTGDMSFDELVGYPYSPEMLAGIDQIDILEKPECKAERTFIVSSKRNKDYLRLRDILVETGLQAEYMNVPDAGDWTQVEELGNTLLPVMILQIIREVFVS